MVRAVTSLLLASASFLTLSATAAQASPSAIQATDCFTPNFVKADHSKPCGWVAFVAYKYLYAEHIEINFYCYHFNATYYGCGGATPIGEKLRCGYIN